MLVLVLPSQETGGRTFCRGEGDQEIGGNEERGRREHAEEPRALHTHPLPTERDHHVLQTRLTRTVC